MQRANASRAIKLDVRMMEFESGWSRVALANTRALQK